MFEVHCRAPDYRGKPGRGSGPIIPPVSSLTPRNPADRRVSGKGVCTFEASHAPRRNGHSPVCDDRQRTGPIRGPLQEHPMTSSSVSSHHAMRRSTPTPNNRRPFASATRTVDFCSRRGITANPEYPQELRERATRLAVEARCDLTPVSVAYTYRILRQRLSRRRVRLPQNGRSPAPIEEIVAFCSSSPRSGSPPDGAGASRGTARLRGGRYSPACVRVRAHHFIA